MADVVTNKESGRRIAIVGTGISGNVAAYLLRGQHEVTVFEANDYVGGHSNTVDVDEDGVSIPVDTGFIVFNDQTYPNFLRLLETLGQDYRDSEMSFSVQHAARNVEYNGSSLNGLFGQRRNLFRPNFHRMVRDILRFNSEAQELLRQPFAHTPLGRYLEANGYSKEFEVMYLVPMAAAIWSSVPDTIREMPIGFLVRFFANHGLLQLKDRPQWKVISGGSRQYVSKLTAGHRDRILLETPVTHVRRNEHGVTVSAAGRADQDFDYVILACHSDQALRLLDDPSDLEQEVIGNIPYQRNEAVLHTDRSVLPNRKCCWAAWNYFVADDSANDMAVTYNMNILQGIESSQQYLVTLNQRERIDPARIIATIAYDHPVFSERGLQAQARQSELNLDGRTLYCGSYWRNGFHEDGVVSAMAAVHDLQEVMQREKRHLQRSA